MKFVRVFNHKRTGKQIEIEIDINLEEVALQMAQATFFTQNKTSTKLYGAIKAKQLPEQPT